MKSSWDETQASSAYHFDTTYHDSRWDTVLGLGRFVGNWSHEVAEAVAKSQPATWETRGYKGPDADIPRADLAAEEYDIERVGADPKSVITHLHWDIAPVFQRMSKLFALEDTMNRIHVQRPGELWNLHIDKLQKWSPENPERVMRIMIQLTDWQPGQFWEYGNYHWNGWKTGDVTTFDWKNVPHSTANAGHHPRVTLQVTGVKTDATEEFLREFSNVREYAV